jgi:phage FluMu protein Com
VPAKHPPPAGTLAFLAECGRTVYIVCNHCNRFVTAKLQDIAKHVGWRANAQEAGKRLRCKECNYVGAKITTERPQVGQRMCPRCLRPYN